MHGGRSQDASMEEAGGAKMRMSYEEVVIITAIATVTYRVVSSLYDYLLGALSSRRRG